MLRCTLTSNLHDLFLKELSSVCVDPEVRIYIQGVRLRAGRYDEDFNERTKDRTSALRHLIYLFKGREYKQSYEYKVAKTRKERAIVAFLYGEKEEKRIFKIWKKYKDKMTELDKVMFDWPYGYKKVKK